MEPEFWLNRWKQRETGFHRDEANSALVKFWPQLNVPKGSTVLVPLCGKTNDMTWLAKRDHKIVGVELSDIAVKSFFDTQNLKPDIRNEYEFKVWSKGPYEVWVGDLFKLPNHVIENCAAVYDRASLVALPSNLQNDYATLLSSQLPQGAQILLVSLMFDQNEMAGPPFSTPPDRIKSLFEDAFQIQELDNKDSLTENDNLKTRGLTALIETCTQLRRQSIT